MNCYTWVKILSLVGIVGALYDCSAGESVRNVTTGSTDTDANRDELVSQLHTNPWQWAYITAGIGADKRTIWTFDDVGKVIVTDKAWVVDQDGTDSWVENTYSGNYTLAPPADLALQWAVDTGVTQETWGRIAVLDNAPQRVWHKDGPKTELGPRALTMRALIRDPSGAYVTQYGAKSNHPSDVYEENIVVTLSFDTPMDPTQNHTCKATLHVTVTRDAESAQETFVWDCQVIAEHIEGWTAVVPTDEKIATAPWDLASNNGVWEKYPSPLDARISEAVETVFYVQPANPNVMVRRYSASPETGWWTIPW